MKMKINVINVRCVNCNQRFKYEAINPLPVVEAEMLGTCLDCLMKSDREKVEDDIVM